MDNKQKHSLKVETHVTVGPATPHFHIDKRRAAIKAALHSAVSGLAVHASTLADQARRLAEEDGGTPPWGEVIIGPVWEQANPPDGGERLQQVAELFWE